MDDLISRQAALDAVINGVCLGCDCDVIDKLKALPTAEPSATLMKVEKGVDMESLKKAMQDAELTLLPAEKKGRWILLSDGWAECSSCEHLERAAGLRWRYCPNCGARLEESE